jgi:hypothetical protein
MFLLNLDTAGNLSLVSNGLRLRCSSSSNANGLCTRKLYIILSFRCSDILILSSGFQRPEAVVAVKRALGSPNPLYLRPRCDPFPAIDVILVTHGGKVLLLRRAISKEHAVSGKVAQSVFVELMEGRFGRDVALVFVVPPNSFYTSKSRRLT